MGAVLRCKMRVEAVVDLKDGDNRKTCEQVTLRAVYGPEGSENAQWARYTPSGNLSMSIDNPNAFGRLPQDAEFYIDFTPAAAAAVRSETMASEAGPSGGPRSDDAAEAAKA